MYERLSNKQETPTLEEFLFHIGKAGESFTIIDIFLKMD